MIDDGGAADSLPRGTQWLSVIGHVALGAFSLGVIGSWAIPAAAARLDPPEQAITVPDFSDAPVVAAGGGLSSAAPPANETTTAANDGDAEYVVAQMEAAAADMVLSEAPAEPRPSAADLVDRTGRTVSDMGCAEDLTASGLDAFFAERRGPLIGWDNPHIYAVDDRRAIWIAHDSYVDHDGSASILGDTYPQMQNVVFLQEDNCFTLVHGGTDEDWHNFETGDGHDHYSRFLWPLGGEIVDDELRMFWSETVQSPNEAEFAGGAQRHPTATYVATYDVDTLERLSFQLAPNSGVSPQYGFAVESDDEFSYLFGNSNQLNLVREGGFDNGPHSATRMYVARVPFGAFDEQPAYWDGDDWVADADQAAVISERFWVENTMQPRLIDGQWVSVVKRDGFFGNEVVVDVAAAPQGPWMEATRVRFEPQHPDVAKNSYQPIITPWSGPETGLVITISENTQIWEDAVAAIDLYRPSALHLDWPTAEILAVNGGGTSSDG